MLQVKVETNHQPKIGIIGAGPAGINAAIQLAKFGLRSTIIDENPSLGGAIFRQPQNVKNNTVLNTDKTKQRFQKLLKQFEKYKEHFSFLFESEVVGTFESEQEVALLRNGKLERYKFDKLIINTGCFERAQPFPGWTLPGVMSVGGAQLQVKSGLVKPGQNIVLVGTGPLLLLAATQLHKSGVKVKGVFEAGRRIDLIKELPMLLSNIPLLIDGLKYLQYLKASNVPVKFGWGIVEALGEKEITHVKVAPFDKKWRPIIPQAKTIETDCLGVEYGFVSRSELTQLLECNCKYMEQSGGLVPIVDEWQRSSKAGIYVAGDSVGVYGSEAAEEEGKIAALGCLIDCEIINVVEASKASKRNRRIISKLIEFRQAFEKFSELRPGLLDLPRADTTICRCEDVKLESISNAINQGVNDMITLKMVTRIGMGDCQGKMCGSFCHEYLKNKTGRSSKEIGSLKPRFPLAPVPFSALLDREKEDE